MNSVVAVAVAMAISASTAPGVAAAADLAPHRAVYTMGLHSARPASGIAGASGTMTYKFSDACDGWTVENRTALAFAYNEGNQVQTDWEFVTWESKDGLRYRFHVRSTRDGMVIDEVDGSAALDGRGQGGKAVFTRPQAMTLRLPKGTMFPTEHTLRLIEHAEAGERIFPSVVFDGSGSDGAFDVNAIIGPKKPPVPEEAGDTLTNLPSWRMNMAFFPVAARAPTPEYEVGLRYFSSGVAKDVVQSFGDFALRARLEKLEPLPKPDC